MAESTCAIDECDGTARKKGWCWAHFNRWRRTGNAAGDGSPVARRTFPSLPQGASPEARFWQKVNKIDGGCWLWLGALHRGYGSCSWDGRTTAAHRVSWLLAGRELDDGLVLDHLCRVLNCVNPDHLEQVTQGQNVYRGDGITAVNKRKTHCIHGHPFDEANTALRVDGSRACRSCRTAQKKAYKARRRGRLAATL